MHKTDAQSFICKNQGIISRLDSVIYFLQVWFPLQISALEELTTLCNSSFNMRATEPSLLAKFAGMYVLRDRLITAEIWDYVLSTETSKCPPPFLFVKTIEKVIRLCTVLKKKWFDDSFKDKAIFHVILEIDR